MTVYKARKLSFFYYLTAAALLLSCLVFRPAVILRWLLYALAVLLGVLGYRVAARYSRCPKCGHVIQVGLFKVTRCSFCSYGIDEKTVYDIS